MDEDLVVDQQKARSLDIPAADTGAGSIELPGLMGNRKWWNTIVDIVRARSTE